MENDAVVTVSTSLTTFHRTKVTSAGGSKQANRMNDKLHAKLQNRRDD